MHRTLQRSISIVNRKLRYLNGRAGGIGDWIYRFSLIFFAFLCGSVWYSRTINMWAMKNIGDTFLRKEIYSRQIILGAFWRDESEQNVEGRYAVIHFLADGRMEHPLYCFSMQANNRYMITRANVQRIHRGKRASSDICSWAGHIAECELDVHSFKDFKISTTPNVEDSMLITPETPLKEPRRHDMVVCMAPMYIYTDWEILITGIETWLAMGASKIVVPVQSASNATYKILQEYEKKGLVIIRPWSKWPILSDTNPNGLVLSRGIEESHVNCLFFVKPWSDIVVFSDIDDFLLPLQPETLKFGDNLRIIRELFAEHPQSGSLLFEHRDVQFVPPQIEGAQSLAKFNFEFLRNSKNKMNCNVWRMKTRVVVNASRVDSVNMHETGIHRLGYVQTRVPCRQAHFYHLRHSHNTVPSPTPINMSPFADLLNKQWTERLETFTDFKTQFLNKTNTEYLEDFDRCMGAINDEHWSMKVSRCLTPHVCFSRLRRQVDCVAVASDYEFYRSGRGYFMNPINSRIQRSETNCESPTPEFIAGNHYFSP
ncbi:unnamed protein product [Caenorhabditis angaria]|uniref:Glycosyltransferase family 92 protein n=1 Tax=Caenorhabditis angaria TaxID=860376 RepID=A0A9P1MZU5_9PELO|nr:unnamed protein product [Caenorhabditis angaria]